MSNMYGGGLSIVHKVIADAIVQKVQEPLHCQQRHTEAAVNVSKIEKYTLKKKKKNEEYVHLSIFVAYLHLQLRKSTFRS